ncbi:MULTISPECIES: hypothetical protein [Enterobacteriaceae]|uniref:hypothetical protein n=1 Tax=Enterobacteriaceae TaxID=543 RepID=UPI0015E9888C|nr:MULTISPECIES: hypothetical protein [Enterobacteriaceae]MDH1754238.1 hypothetical protein [Citrobacter braakii]MDH1852562.1 hypothetical protein [Citrobacter braakii]QLY63739.1 hypothetical protein HV228_02595 [Enterobacter asburiae]
MAFIVYLNHTNVAQRTKPESDPAITYTGFIGQLAVGNFGFPAFPEPNQGMINALPAIVDLYLVCVVQFYVLYQLGLR